MQPVPRIFKTRMPIFTPQAGFITLNKSILFLTGL
jgi:hypothetical protein